MDRSHTTQGQKLKPAQQEEMVQSDIQVQKYTSAESITRAILEELQNIRREMGHMQRDIGLIRRDNQENRKKIDEQRQERMKLQYKFHQLLINMNIGQNQGQQQRIPLRSRSRQQKNHVRSSSNMRSPPINICIPSSPINTSPYGVIPSSQRKISPYGVIPSSQRKISPYGVIPSSPRKISPYGVIPSSPRKISQSPQVEIPSSLRKISQQIHPFPANVYTERTSIPLRKVHPRNTESQSDKKYPLTYKNPKS